MSEPLLTQAELEAFDVSVVAALDARDNAGLHVVGYGELSIALGYPKEEPRVVCKPTSPYRPSELDDYKGSILRYVELLAGAGIEVVPTSLMSVARDDRVVGYQIQPLLEPRSIADQILAAAEPDAEHPFLVALAAVVGSLSDRLSVDAQVTNWAWDGQKPTLIDVGSPLMWDEAGAYLFDVKPLFRAIPTPLRPFAMRDIAKLVERYRTPRNVAADVVANLSRIELDRWVQPALVAFNRALRLTTPIRESEARAIAAADFKAMPRLKLMQKAERAWVTNVRRRRYDYFVQPTTINRPRS